LLVHSCQSAHCQSGIHSSGSSGSTAAGVIIFCQVPVLVPPLPELEELEL